MGLSRYDFILIWGDDLSYKDKIIKCIEHHPSFEIIKILKYKCSNAKKLMKTIYLHSNAPIQYIKNRIKYAHKNISEVIFIFIKNNNPDEDYVGDDAYRHIESQTLKKFGEFIGDIYNEKKAEENIISISYNQRQTDHVLKFLGFDGGVEEITTSASNILNIPYHIKKKTEIILKEVDIDKLRASILTEENGSIKGRAIPLNQTPQYQALTFQNKAYQDYLDKFQGTIIQDYYSEEKLLNLAKYIHYPYKNNYIVAKKKNDYWLIIDGVHRASILKYKGVRKVIIAEVA